MISEWEMRVSIGGLMGGRGSAGEPRAMEAAMRLIKGSLHYASWDSRGDWVRVSHVPVSFKGLMGMAMIWACARLAGLRIALAVLSGSAARGMIGASNIAKRLKLVASQMRSICNLMYELSFLLCPFES